MNSATGFHKPLGIVMCAILTLLLGNPRIELLTHMRCVAFLFRDQALDCRYVKNFKLVTVLPQCCCTRSLQELLLYLTSSIL